MKQKITAAIAGGAALDALRGGDARVFAAFERSCYVETAAGIACLGGPEIGRGPLNAIVEGVFGVSALDLEIDISHTKIWMPAPASGKPRAYPDLAIPESLRASSMAFSLWLLDPAARSPDELIGLGPGLTPAGDDFVGGAMIALRGAGETALADRVAAWALPLAEQRTSRISRAHLQCAASGQGHEALHRLLAALNQDKKTIAQAIDALSRVGHSSGLDAAAGALLALRH